MRNTGAGVAGDPPVRRRKSNGEQGAAPASLLHSGRIPMTSLLQALAVADYLNFRHAANALGVSQSSVSARMKTLEEDLGVLLFERHSRGIRLTSAGRRFIQTAAVGIDQIDHAINTAGLVARGEAGRLRIGVHALIPGGFLAQLIAHYREKHPNIDLGITEGTAREAVAQLRASRLDVAFVANAPEIPDCHSRTVWTERVLVALPSSHPLAEQTRVVWPDLATETFLVRHAGVGPQVYDHIRLRLAKLWPSPAIIRFDVERATLLSMVAQGFGVTITGDEAALTPSPGVAFLPIADEPEAVTFSALWSPRNRDTALANLLALAGRMRKA